jgi:transglutaminase-like putative cysteine protease
MFLLYTQIMRDKPVRWWDFPAAAFLAIALFAASVRLQTTNWTEHLSLTQWLVLLALALGLALGKSRFGPRLSFLFGTVYSITFVPWSLAGLIRSELWLERLQSLTGRLATAAQQMLTNQPVKDPILILSFLCLLYWLAGLTAGFQLTRNARPWGGVVVVGIVVLIVDYSFEMYAANDSGTALSLLYFLFTVTLIGRVYFLRSRQEWNSRGQMIENEVGFDISRGAAITALVLVLLSWLSPRAIQSFTPGTIESYKMSDRFEELRNRISNAVSSLNSKAPLIVETLGDSIALGRGTNLSDEVVFTIKPDGGKLSAGGARFYWAGRIYDTYLNGAWSATDTQPTLFGPGYAQPAYAWQGRREVTVDITTRISLLRTLYYPDAPITITRPVIAEIAPSSLEEPDITALMIDPPIKAGENYRVRSTISAPSFTLLRESAKLPYPDWITTRYLRLPANFSSRVTALAQSITSGVETPYDKTAAVTKWLRDNITYQTTVPELPVNIDPVEWFLFDIKAGFCNYYATSEVLMLRSLGIPARLVVGYAEGTWVSETSQYEINGKDYHAWPEVYFPSIGWVPFEPTSSQRVLDYPSEGQTTNPASSGQSLGIPTPFVPPLSGVGVDDPTLTALLQQQASQRRMRSLVFVTALSSAIGLLAYAIFRWRKYSLKGLPTATWFEQALTSRGVRAPRWLVNWSVRARRTPMEKVFAVIPEMLRVWGQPLETDLTPAEQVRRLEQTVPELSPYSSALLNEYHRAAYSRQKADLYRARRAAGELRQKGYRIWFQRLMRIGS